MSRVGRLAALPFAIAIGGVLLAGAPAYAAVKATWTTPTDNSTYTTDAPIDFAVTLERGVLDSGTVTLSLAVPGPQAGPFKVATSTGSSSPSSLRFTFTPSCANAAGPCASGGTPAYNGRYTASLSGSATGLRNVVLQIPPAAPTGVTATATGQNRVKVSWAANTEPDLTGYDVFTDDGSAVAQSLPTTQLSYEFSLPSSGYGGEHRYVVRARRLACANCEGSPDSGTELYSPMSDAASVTLVEATTAPSGSGGSTGTGSGGGNFGSGHNNGNGNGNGNSDGGTTAPAGNDGGNTSGDFSSGSKPTVAQQRAAFGVTFKSFAPKLGAPKLPPLPKFAEQPIPEGTYNPTLDYGDQTITEKQSVATGGITSQLVDSVTAAFQGRKLYRSIAIALLLLLAAGHLRLWLRTADHQH